MKTKLKGLASVAYLLNGREVFRGRVEYITNDNWLGIRQADGSLDEAPATRCVVLRHGAEFTSNAQGL
jgi:hypothetical protein